MHVNGHTAGVRKLSDSEQLESCSHLLQTPLRRSVFTAHFLLNINRHWWCLLHNRQRSVFIFHDTQSWNKTKQNPKKIMSRVWIRSQAAYLLAGCSFSSYISTAKLHSVPHCCSIRWVRVQEQGEMLTFPSCPFPQDIFLLS